MKKSYKSKIPLPYLLTLLVAIPLLISNFYFWQKSERLEKQFIVKKVIDGDTFVLEDKSIIKLFSIEAPEFNLCGGQEAKKELEKLVLNKKVNVSTQVRDKYGRKLGLVYLGNRFVNLEMLETGWARYNGANSPRKEDLKTAQQQAKDDKRGIFSSQCLQFQNLENPLCQIKGNISKVSGEKIYHFPGCGRYEDVPVELDLGDEWFCSEKDAEKEGFVKSKNCFERKFKP